MKPRKDIPGCIVFAKRLTVPNFNAYFEVIPAIGRAVVEANPGLQCATPEYCFISYLDGEFKQSDITIEYRLARMQQARRHPVYSSNNSNP